MSLEILRDMYHKGLRGHPVHDDRGGTVRKVQIVTVTFPRETTLSLPSSAGVACGIYRVAVVVALP